MIAAPIGFCVAELRFLDSNVLIYAISRHEADVEKRVIANRILQEEDVCLSTQVMQEFYVNATMKGGMADVEAKEWLAELVEYPCAETSRAVVFSAIDHAGRYRISYWDAAIVAAAERLGAKILYTEDLNHGQRYGDVTVDNPFRDVPRH